MRENQHLLKRTSIDSHLSLTENMMFQSKLYKVPKLDAKQRMETHACLMTGPTNIMHFIGLPSLALRLCMAEDETPCGMILYGADERRLFAVVLIIEKYCASFTMPKI